MPDMFNTTIPVDWGTETLRWTAGDEGILLSESRGAAVETRAGVRRG